MSRAQSRIVIVYVYLVASSVFANWPAGHQSKRPNSSYTSTASPKRSIRGSGPSACPSSCYICYFRGSSDETQVRCYAKGEIGVFADATAECPLSAVADCRDAARQLLVENEIAVTAYIIGTAVVAVSYQ